jgi:hypothetical protein
MTFAYLGALGQGIKRVERDNVWMECGCDASRGGEFLGYVVTMGGKGKCDHFSQHCDRRNLAEHRATHKRRRKKCDYCQGRKTP